MLETFTTGREAFSGYAEFDVRLVGDLDTASLYLGGGVSLVNARISSIEEKSLQLRLCRLIESGRLDLALDFELLGL